MELFDKWTYSYEGEKDLLKYFETFLELDSEIGEHEFVYKPDSLFPAGHLFSLTIQTNPLFSAILRFGWSCLLILQIDRILTYLCVKTLQ